MNEHIAKLANQSGFDVDDSGKFGNYSEMHRLEKFAELIVRECAELNFRELGLSGSSSFDVGRMIKQHFGVEN